MEPQDLPKLLADLEIIQKIKRDSPIRLVRLNRPQMEMTSSDATFRCFFGGNKSGKANSSETGVLTPVGQRCIGDLKVGDAVIAGDGSPTRVLGVFPQGKRRLFRCTFDEGVTVDADLNHNWLLKTPHARFRKDRVGYGRHSVMTTQEILDRFGSNPPPTQRVAIPAPGPVGFAYQPVELDGYLLGVLLGDGCFRTNTLSFCKPDLSVHEQLKESLPRGYGWSGSVTERNGRLLLRSPSGENRIVKYLRDVDLWKRYSYQKFVPDEYLYNSPTVRHAVLQGLLDTDGGPAGNGIEFSSTSEDLADAVIFLTRSLGGKASKSGPRITQYPLHGEMKNGRPSWRVWVRLPQEFAPFRSQGKSLRIKDKGLRTKDRILHSIEEIEPDEAHCIMVDHPSHTYMTEDFVVTHNSYWGHIEDVSYCRGERAYLPENHSRFRTPFKPPVRGMVFAETWDKVEEIHIPGFMKWIPKGEAQPIKRAGYIRGFKFVAGPGKGSEIRFATYEMESDKLEGADYHYYHFDEPPPFRHWAPTTRGIVVNRGKIWLTLTLLSEGWIWDEIWEKAEDGDPNYFAVVGTMEENPSLDPEAIKIFAGGLDESEREVRLSGRPKHLQGRVFKHFQDKSPWVVEPWDIPIDWPTIRCFDPHLAKPLATLWVKVCPSGQLVVTDELYDGSFENLDGFRLRLQEIEKRRHPHVAMSLMDPSGYSPNGLGGTSYFDLFRRYGIQVSPAPKSDRFARFADTAARFQLDKYTEGPGIVIFKSCERLRWEIKRFVHPDTRSGSRTDHWKDLPEGKKKIDDDLIDDLTYIVSKNPQFDWLQRGANVIAMAEPYRDIEPAYGGRSDAVQDSPY